ncbi:MAG: SGNH/GDSL hydrolase family protein [Sphaerochaetaceae bacterium]|jgi:lysophospholipase L1-like esterase
MKTYSVIGDSISTFQGWIPSYCECAYPSDIRGDVKQVTQTWWHILGEKMLWKLEVNQSYSGSRVTETGPRPIWSSCKSDRRLSDLGNPDYILIMAGTNDFGQELDLPSLELFQDSYRELLGSLKERFPEAIVYCMTPLQRTIEALDWKNSMNWTQLDLADAVRKAAAEYGDFVIDLAAFPISAGDGYLADGLHPSAKGMALVASLAEKAIRQSMEG